MDAKTARANLKTKEYSDWLTIVLELIEGASGSKTSYAFGNPFTPGRFTKEDIKALEKLGFKLEFIADEGEKKKPSLENCNTLIVSW